MELVFFLLGVVLAFAIAKYNESNKLFWQLAGVLTLGYAVTTICTHMVGEKENNENLQKVQVPMSKPSVITGNTCNYNSLAMKMAPAKVTASNSTSQDFTPESKEINVVLSEVYGRTRDQPVLTFTPPPE